MKISVETILALIAFSQGKPIEYYEGISNTWNPWTREYVQPQLFHYRIAAK